MIRNFEEYTDEMTDDERNFILPRIIQILSLAIGREKAVSNKQILLSINSDFRMIDPDISEEAKKMQKVKTRPARIRHMIHILRVSHTIPFLVAGHYGYHISCDPEEIENYIGSIDDRLRSIYALRRALKHQVKHYEYQTEPVQGTLIF